MKAGMGSTIRAEEQLPPLFGPPRALAIAAGVYALLTLVIFAIALTSGPGHRIVSMGNWDLPNQFIPWRQFGFGQLAKGHFVLWNPHVFCGAPYLGGFQSALLYPPNWLYLVLPITWAVNVGVALHVVLAGVWTWCWAARRGLNTAACFVAGLTFMLGGPHFMHIWAGHLPNLCTMIWAPLIFLCVDDLTLTRSWRGAWVGAGAVAMAILAGHPQYVFYTAVGVGLYSLLVLRGAPDLRRSLTGLAMVCLGGVGLSAAQLFTGLSAADQSARASLSYDIAGTYSLAPENLLTFLFPRIFGDGERIAFWGRWLIWEQSQYIGATVLFLAIYGAVRGPKPLRRFSITMVVVSLLLALGYYTPLFNVIHALPGFSSFRGIAKFSFLLLLFVAMLAGIGADRAMKEPIPRPALLGAAGVVFLLIVAAIVTAPRVGVPLWPWLVKNYYSHGFGMEKHPPANIEQYAVQCAALVTSDAVQAALALLLVIGAAWLARTRPKVAWALPALALAELFSFAVRLPSFPIEDYQQQTDQVRRVTSGLKPDDRLYSIHQGIVLGADRDNSWGDDPMVPRRFAEVTHFDGKSIAKDFLLSPLERLSPMWRMLRVRGAVVMAPDIRLQETDKSKWDPLERALLVDHWEVLDDPLALAGTLHDERFDFRRMVLLEEQVDLSAGNAATAAATLPGRVQVIDHSTEEIEVTVDTPRSTILLMTDNYSPDWSATPLEGASQSAYLVVPGNYTLRAIPLLAGHHHFQLRYKPTAWLLGRCVSLVALPSWLGLAMWHLIRTRRQRAKPAV